jgi:heme/copper-type cytochrome/quinol oxidase subunit 2
LRKIILFFSLVTLFLVSCSSTQTGSSNTGVVKEFKISIIHAAGYTPNTFTVNKGDTVRFLVTSDPLFHEHGITISEFNLSVKVTAGEKDTPQVIEFVADKAGEFLIWCGTCLTGPIGDHPWMRGKLIVKP